MLEVENTTWQKVLEDERRELERLEVLKQLKGAEARMKVYEQNEDCEDETKQLLYACELEKERNNDHVRCTPYIPDVFPPHTATPPQPGNSIATLAKGISRN